MVRAYLIKLLILAMLIITGILLDAAGVVDADKILDITRQYSDHWWLALVLILLQAVLFTFALAGSFFVWIAAPLYPPAMATVILAAGGTFGGMGAYLFSRHLSDDWIRRIEDSPTYRLLQQHNNFFTLFAMRVFPTFPHSLVNYSAGILKVKLFHFIAAAIAGLTIKSYIYSSAIHNATTTLSPGELLNINTYGPLMLLSILSLAAVFIRYKLQQRDNENRR